MKTSIKIQGIFYLIIFNLLICNLQSGKAQMFWNQSCQFFGNSSSYVAVPNSGTVDIIGSFSIEAWVNPATLSGFSKGIISKGGTLGTSLKYGIRLTNSGRITLSTNGIERLISKASTPMTVNQWTHVTVTYSSFLSQFKIYFNGALDTSAIITGATPTTNSDSLFIGISGASTPFNGKLDEVRLWRKVISDADVAKFYRTSLGASTGIYANLIMSLTFQTHNASIGSNNLRDWSENSNHSFGRNVILVSQLGQLYTTIDHNECAEFDGNEDYLESVDPLELGTNVTNYFTMQCWVYPRAAGQANLILAPVGPFDSDFSLYVNSEGKIQASVENITYLSGSSGTLPLNRWTHVAFVLNELSGKFYFNGKLINNHLTSIVNLIPDGNKLFIGGGPGALADFNGFIDEVRITTTSFKQTQLLNEMNISLEKSFRTSPNYDDYVYNLDGLLTDNMDDGGPRLEFKGNTKFSHPSTTPNQPVSPLTRGFGEDLAKGFYVNNLSKRIPASGNSGSTVDSFSINKSTSINDINLFLALNHTNLPDLKVVITGPEGDSAVVFNNISNTGQNDNLTTIFDDNTANILTNGIYTSFTPSVRAQINLNPIFAGSDSHGYWKIRITDNGGADTGRLYAWGVQINNMQERESNLNVHALIQGFYNEPLNKMVKDTMKVYLWINVFGNQLLDSSTAVLSEQGEGLFSIKNSSLFPFEGAPYFIQLKHRNAIETWSNPPVHYVVFEGFDASYDFRNDDSKALGNNMVPVDITPIRYAFYSGDENQDGNVDLADVVNVFNDANNFVNGYVASDMTGDNTTDLADLVITYNNSVLFVSAVTL